MNSISNQFVNLHQLGAPGPSAAGLTGDKQGEDATELHDAFTRFVGQTFYGQMMKSMRSTVGKPAYFYGGQAEEVFRGQLDQTMVEHLSEASADQFAEPMFRQQFPKLAAAAESQARPGNEMQSNLYELNALARR